VDDSLAKQFARYVIDMPDCSTRRWIPRTIAIPTVVVVLNGCAMAARQQAETSFELRAEPTRISAGNEATLQWQTGTAATRVLLSDVGLVDRSGRVTVKPLASTVYTLVAEGPFGVVTRSVTIDVDGTRGNDFPDSYDGFRFPITARRQAPSFVDLLESLRRALEARARAPVAGPMPSTSGHLLLVTGFATAATDSCGAETNLGERRVAYLIDLEPQTRADQWYAFTIKTFYQYRRRIERTWRTGDCREWYRSAAESLRSALETIVPNARGDAPAPKR
jgi:hypothetical protein